MEEMVTIPRKEYEELKRKAKENTTEEHFEEVMDDLRKGKVREIKGL